MADKQFPFDAIADCWGSYREVVIGGDATNTTVLLHQISVAAGASSAVGLIRKRLPWTSLNPADAQMIQSLLTDVLHEAHSLTCEAERLLAQSEDIH